MEDNFDPGSLDRLSSFTLVLSRAVISNIARVFCITAAGTLYGGF